MADHEHQWFYFFTDADEVTFFNDRLPNRRECSLCHLTQKMLWTEVFNAQHETLSRVVKAPHGEG